MNTEHIHPVATTTPHMHVHETTSTAHVHIHGTTTSTVHMHVHDTTLSTAHFHGASSPTTGGHVHVHETTTPMDHSNHGSGSGNSGMQHDMMQMFYHGGYKEIILFDFWRTSNVELFVLSCFAIFVVSFLYEGLKLLRHNMLINELKSKIGCQCNQVPKSKKNKFDIEEATAAAASTKSKIPFISLSKGCVIQALIYMFQTIISYSLMLVFMTFNTWLCLSLVLGTGLGYVIFGHKRAFMDIDTNCH